MVTAALAAAAAVALLVGPRPVLAVSESPDRATSRARLRALLVVMVVLVGGLVVAGGRLAVLVVAVGLVAAVGVRIVRAQVRRSQTHACAAGVEAVCDLLAADLASGVSPDRALEAAAAAWSPAAAIMEAHRVDADLPQAWRTLALRPGAGGARLIAGAWELSQVNGIPLSPLLARVADDLRADRATARIVTSELSSARATARILAVLPVAAWAMGSGTGARPLAFLIGGPVGWFCLLGGLGCGLGGLWWIERLAGQADPAQAVGR